MMKWYKLCTQCLLVLMVFLYYNGCIIHIENQRYASQIRISDDDTYAILIAYSRYYKVNYVIVEDLYLQGYSFDDISVILFIHVYTQYDIPYIIKYHKKGYNWFATCVELGVNFEFLFIDLPSNYQPGPPFGKAYGYYRTRNYRKMKLTDYEIASLVQLKFAVRHFGYKPEHVIKKIQKGKKVHMIVLEKARARYLHSKKKKKTVKHKRPSYAKEEKKATKKIPKKKEGSKINKTPKKKKTPKVQKIPQSPKKMPKGSKSKDKKKENKKNKK